MRNLRIIVLACFVFLLAITTPTSSTEPDNWREQYFRSNSAYTALRDFDEAGMRIGDLLDRLEQSGDLSGTGNAEIALFFEQLEQEYMSRWFGDESRYDVLSSSQPTGTSTNNRYDREFREQSRSNSPTSSGGKPGNSE